MILTEYCNDFQTILIDLKLFSLNDQTVLTVF